MNRGPGGLGGVLLLWGLGCASTPAMTAPAKEAAAVHATAPVDRGPPVDPEDLPLLATVEEIQLAQEAGLSVLIVEGTLQAAPRRLKGFGPLHVFFLERDGQTLGFAFDAQGQRSVTEAIQGLQAGEPVLVIYDIEWGARNAVFIKKATPVLLDGPEETSPEEAVP
ncbi:MAG: hypothetical protein EOO71_25500 [Myxococcaceae bacterium]|nr:MAG: hypothetical protein EOO71_25500 [Myxococcaceae bacterium]